MTGADAALRRQLEEERQETANRRADLRLAIDSIVEASESNALDDEHDPDGSGVAYERAQLISLLERADLRLGELDLAIERLDAGNYGKCEQCGDYIGAERLQAIPSTQRCHRCASGSNLRLKP